MSFYIQSLFIAIPIFFILIILEWTASKKIGKKVNRSTDVISSLSSGMSNITKDSLNLGVVLISYGWLVKHLTVHKLEPLWLATLFAFIIQDFTGYWMHRLNHRVNIFGIGMLFIIVVKNLIYPVRFVRAYQRQYILAHYL